MKRTLTTLAPLILGAALLLSCSDGGGGPAEPGGGSGGEPVTGTITPAGGSIAATTTNGTSVLLEFPAGAVNVNTAITLRPADATGDAFFGVLLEPEGIIFLADVAVTVTVPDGVDFADQQLFFGDPVDPVLIPTVMDEGARTLKTTILGFGIPSNNPVAATSSPATQTPPPNNLGGLQQTCQQVLAQAQASFDSFIAQENFEAALHTALESAALLQKAACPAEVQQWIDIVSNTACTRVEDAINAANQATITSHGDFEKYTGPIIDWIGVAAQLSPDCPASIDYLTALDGMIAKILVWYGQQLSTLTGPNLQTFSNLKQELVHVVTLMEQAMQLGLGDAAERIEDNAFDPTLVQMRESAYGLGQNDNWHYALTKLVTWGFFAGRDIIGVADPRICDTDYSPPKCYAVPQQFGFITGGPFTDEEVYDDIQFCATHIEFETLAASDTIYTSDTAGGDGAPGQQTSEFSIKCPTRGTIKIGGKIGTLTCFLTDDDADSEIVFKLDGTDVLGILRPSNADDYFDGTPAEIDIVQAAADAGITPKGGDTHDLTIVRKRRNCSDLLWGEQEFTLLKTTLEWVNPTAAVAVNMPQNINPGETVNVDVRVKVIDQLGKDGFFDAIDVVLQSSGGTLQQLSGTTDAQGYFRTQLTADSPQPIVDATTGAVAQGVQVDATATLFEGVTAQGSATAGVGAVGYARVLSAQYYGQARAGGFRVFDDKDDESTTPGPWSFSANAQADSSYDNKTYSGAASINSSIELTESNDTLTTISGSVNGSAQLTADGAFLGIELPEVVHRTEMMVEFEVLDGPIGVIIDANTAATSRYEITFDVSGAGFGTIYDDETPPPTYHQLYGLGPGVHTMIVSVRNRVSCCCCTDDGTTTFDFTIKLGGPPLGGGSRNKTALDPF